MNTKNFTFALAVASFLAFNGLGINLPNRNTSSIPIAQAASCDTSFHSERFTLRVGSTTGVNLRSERRLDARTNENVGYNVPIEFEGWAYGESVPDLSTNKPDALWFKLKDQDRWVPSAYMMGYPPSQPSIQPNCPGGGQVDMAGLQKLLFGNVPSTVTSPYGYQRCDIWKGIYVDCKHPGLDIAGPANTPIYSPIDGVVIRRSDNIGAIGIYNQKSNITFFFAHMNRTDVKVNDLVAKGQPIGIEGTKGYVTGPHLHFEARPGKQYYMAIDIKKTINPLDAVNQANR